MFLPQQPAQCTNASAALLLLAEPRSRGPSELVKLIWDPFTARKPDVQLTSELIQKLRPFLLYMAVYGRCTPSDRCSLFEQLHLEFSSAARYLVREVEGTTQHGLSINRCTEETAGFLPHKFKQSNIIIHWLLLLLMYWNNVPVFKIILNDFPENMNSTKLQ